MHTETHQFDNTMHQGPLCKKEKSEVHKINIPGSKEDNVTANSTVFLNDMSPQ